jgi:tetratricopeptide (TPR) repeat protein
VVGEYVLAKIGKEECKKLHKRASDFYIHKHDDLLKRISEDMRAEPLKGLCAVMEMLRQRGMREQADALVNSLLEIHHHLFESGDYEQAGDIVIAIYDYLDMQGLRELAKELLKKSVDSLEGYNKYLAKANLGILFNGEGKWQEALNTVQECLEFFRSIDAKSEMATIISEHALIYRQQGEYERALSLERQESLALREEIGDKEGIVISHFRITQLLDLMEKYEEALKQGEKGLGMARELGNQRFEAKYINMLGLILNHLNRSADAFERFQECLNIYEQIGDKAGQADSLSEIGKLLLAAGQFKVALDCFQRALNAYRELDDPVKVAILLVAIGVVFGEQEHYEEALIKFQEALQLFQQYGSPQDIAHAERNIARVKNLLGQR